MSNNQQTLEIGPKLAQIPSSWCVIKMKKLGNVRPGGVNKKSKKDQEEVNLVNYMDVYDNVRHVIDSSINFMRVTAKDSQLEKFDVQIGDVLFTPSSETPNDIGLSAVVVEDLKNTLYSYHLLRLRFTKEVDLQFKRYLFHNKYVLDQFQQIAQGLTRFVLNKKHFVDVKVPLPTASEQRKIAEILSTVDELIKKTHEIIETTKQIKKGLMQFLLTKGIGHKEFKEVQVGPKKEEIPKEWKVKKIEEVFNIKAGGDVDKELYSENKDNKHPYPIYANSSKDNGLYGYSSEFTYPEGCVTITGRGDLGAAIYRKQKFNAIVRLIVLIPEENINGKFIAEYINQKVNFPQESTGVPQLTRPTVSSISICLPPIEDQKMIAEIFSTVDKKIEKEKEYKEQLQQLKKGLMQDLLTGKVRVTDLIKD